MVGLRIEAPPFRPLCCDDPQNPPRVGAGLKTAPPAAAPNDSAVPRQLSTLTTMRITIIATDPGPTDSIVVTGDGDGEEAATAAALAQVPDGWNTVSFRRV